MMDVITRRSVFYLQSDQQEEEGNQDLQTSFKGSELLKVEYGGCVLKDVFSKINQSHPQN